VGRLADPRDIWHEFPIAEVLFDSMAVLNHAPAVAAPRSELTVRGLLIGAVITVLFTAANVFAGLKVGLTFSTSIPAAVISMAILRGFKNSTIQENNIVQTVASSAGTLSSVVFVLPGLMIIGWWSAIPFWQTFAVCALGGLIGVMYSIPLRRALVAQSDLPYPEGVAAAEVLQVGAGAKATTPEAIAESNAGVRTIFIGGAVSAGFAVLKAMRVFTDETAKAVTVGRFFSRVNPSFSFVLLGIGHLVGLSVGVAMLLGLLISWAGAVPLYAAQAHLAPGPDLIGALGAIFTSKVRFIGAGAIAVAAVWTLLKLIVPVWGGLTSAMRASKSRGVGEALPRTEQDLPIGLVGMISLASLVPIGVLLAGFLKGGVLQPLTLPLAVAGVAYIVIIGLFVAAVVGYMAGLIGASNSPLSGVGILAVVGVASLLAVFIKPLVGDAASQTLIAFSLFVTAVVFTIGAIANDNLQDLKTGQLVDATPWKQQASLVFGVLAGAITIPLVLAVLARAYGFAGAAGAGPQALGAPQANLIAALAKGIIGGHLQQNALMIGIILGVVLVVLDEILRMTKVMRIPPLAVGLGIYLPMSATLFVVIGAVIGHIYEAITDKSPRPALGKRLGVLLASGLIVGESLFGVINAGLVSAAQTGWLWMPKDAPSAQAPLGVLPAGFPESALGVALTTVVFATITAALYLWVPRQAKASK
jgi:putative OPT family oligopeptide transporter